MRHSIQWGILAALGLALPLAAQVPPAEIPVIGESIDVRVINVEAVITDAAGKPVRGLPAGDFRLLVDGQEVPIEFFTEVEEGTSVGAGPAAEASAGPAAPVSTGEEVGRSYLVYVDDSFSLRSRRNDVLAKLERDLSLLRPADRMAVLAFDGSRIDTLCGWTGDVGMLRGALAQARKRTALGGRMLAHQQALSKDVDWVWENAESIDSGDSSGAAGVRASEIGEILGAMSKRISPEARTQLGRTAAAATSALRGFEAPPGRKVLLFLSGAWSLSVAPDLYEPFVENANRLGYTVYPVDASQSDATEVTALDMLARATGGRAVVSAANDAFREVVADSGSYYWLGFSPTWKADGRSRRVTVEVRRPELKVRSRNGFSDRSSRTETTAKAEKVLLFGGTEEEKRLLVELGEPRQKGKTLEVPVTLGVPVEALAPRPEGEGYLAEIPLAVASEDKNGGRADQPGMHLKVMMAKLPPVGTYARFQTVLQIRDVEQRLVFTIQDPASGQTFWGQADFVPGRVAR